MQKTLLSMIALLAASASGASAQVTSSQCDFDNRSNVVVWAACPQKGETAAAVAKPDAEAEAYIREETQRVIDAGGCNADFLPHWMAAGCFNNAVHGDPGAPIGSSTGGSD